MRGHHVSCFLSQLLQRPAQRGSIAAAFREHSPSRPSPLPGPSSAPLQGACQLPRPARAPGAPGAPRRRLPRSPSPDRPTASPGHHPALPGAARFEVEPGRRGRERVYLWGCRGAARGERPKTRRGAPATRGHACCGAQAGPGAHARARDRAPAPRGPSAPLPVAPTAQVSAYSPSVAPRGVSRESQTGGANTVIQDLSNRFCGFGC